MDSEASETDTPSGTPEDAFAARLDQLEKVLREELEAQTRRAERAEAQLRTLGDIDRQADELVTTARAEAARVTEAARQQYDEAAAARTEAATARAEAATTRAQASSMKSEVAALLDDARRMAGRLAEAGQGEPDESSSGPSAGFGGVDEELLRILREHIILVGAVQEEMINETRRAIVQILAATGRVRVLATGDLRSNEAGPDGVTPAAGWSDDRQDDRGQDQEAADADENGGQPGAATGPELVGGAAANHRSNVLLESVESAHEGAHVPVGRRRFIRLTGGAGGFLRHDAP